MGSEEAGPGGKAVEKIERFTEVPMLFLALAYIPVFVVEYVPDVSPGVRTSYSGLSSPPSRWN